MAFSNTTPQRTNYTVGTGVNAKTYETVGNREDLLDIITNISPDETPLMNKFGRSKVTAMTHSWLTDRLPDVNQSNKVIESAAFSDSAAIPRVKLDNYIQIFMKDCNVTDSQEAVLKAGIKSEMAYQLAKTLKAIALDVEYAILHNSTAVRGDESTPGQFGGIPYFVNSTKTPNNIVDATASATYAYKELDETKLNDAIQKAWAKGGTPDVCVVSGQNKRVISGFSSQERRRSADETKLKKIIDVYESDFGLVNMLLHRQQENNRVDLLQTEYWKLAYLIPFKTYDKPKDSLVNGKVVTGQLTLECRSPEANSAITGIDNTDHA